MDFEERIKVLESAAAEFYAKASEQKLPAWRDYYFRRAVAIREAIALLRTCPAAQQNEPLTPEELQEMGGKPYWHVGLQEDSPLPHWAILDPVCAPHIEDYGYGKRWLAYRYPL